MGNAETPTASPRATGGAEADALEALLNMRSIAASETRGERVLQIAGSDRLASHQGSLRAPETGASETGDKDSTHQPQKPNAAKHDVNIDSTARSQQQSLARSEAVGAPGSRPGSFTGKKRKPIEGNEDGHGGPVMMRSADGRSGPITLGERLMSSAAGSRPANDGGRRFSHVIASTYDGVQDAGWRVASEPTMGGDEERLRLGRIPSDEDAAPDRLHNNIASGSSGAGTAGSETPPSAKRLHVARLQQAALGGAAAAGGAGVGGVPGGPAWQQQAVGPGASIRRASLSEFDGPAAAGGLPPLPNQPSPQQKAGGGVVAVPPSLPRVALRAVRNCNPPSPLGQGSDTGSDPGSPSGGPAAWCPSPGRIPLGEPPAAAPVGGGGKATDSAGGGSTAAVPGGEDAPPNGAVRTGSVISLLHMLAIRQQQQQQQQELGRQGARSGVGHDVGMEDAASQGAPDRLERHPTLDPAGLQQVQPHPSHPRGSDTEPPPPAQGPAGRRASASASRGAHAPNPTTAQQPPQPPPLIRGSSLPSRDRSHVAPLDPRERDRDREYGAQPQDVLWMERELGREQRPAAQRGPGPAPPSLSGEFPLLGHSQSHVSAPALLPPHSGSISTSAGGGAGPAAGQSHTLVRHMSDVAQRERERERDWAAGGVADMEGVAVGRGGALQGSAVGHPQGGVAAPTDDPQRVTASLANIERKLLMQEQRLIFELQQVRLMQKLLQVQQMKQRVREAMLLHEQDGAVPMDATPFTTGGGMASGAGASGLPVARGARAASVTGPAAARSAVYGDLEGMDIIRSGSEPYMRHRPPMAGQQHGPAAGGGGAAGRQQGAGQQQLQRGLVGDRHEDSRHGPHGLVAEPVGVGGDGGGARAAGLGGKASAGGGDWSGGGGGEVLQGGAKEATESLSSRLLSYMAAMSSKGGEGDARAFQWLQERQAPQQQQQQSRDRDWEQLLRQRGHHESEEPPPLPQRKQQQQQREGERDRERELQRVVQGPRELVQVKGEMIDGPGGMEQ